MPKSQYNTLISRDKFDRVKEQNNCEQFILLKLNHGSRFLNDEMDLSASIRLVLKCNGYWYYSREELEFFKSPIPNASCTRSVTRYYRTTFVNQVNYNKSRELLIPTPEFLLNHSMSIDKTMRISTAVSLNVKVKDPEPS